MKRKTIGVLDVEVQDLLLECDSFSHRTVRNRSVHLFIHAVLLCQHRKFQILPPFPQKRVHERQHDCMGRYSSLKFEGSRLKALVEKWHHILSRI